MKHGKIEIERSKKVTSHAALDILLRDSLEGHLLFLWSRIGSSHIWENQSQLAKKNLPCEKKERKKSSSLCDVWCRDAWYFLDIYTNTRQAKMMMTIRKNEREIERERRWLIGYLLVLKVVISAASAFVLFTLVILCFL